MARAFLGTHYNQNIQGQYRGDKKYQTSYSNKYFNQPPYPQRNSGDVYKVLEGQTKISKYVIFTKTSALAVLPPYLMSHVSMFFFFPISTTFTQDIGQRV